MKSGAWAAVALALVLAACGNKLQTREAVEKGVLKGVASRGINADSMDVTVSSVKFHDNKADAVVSFAPKGGKLSDGLTMRYELEQRDGEWVIIGRSGMDLKQHSGGMETPPNTMDQNSGAMPPSTSVDRPVPGSVPESSGSNLPPGHPPVDGTTK